MTSYTLNVQPRVQYTIEYANQRGPQGATGAAGAATTDASLLVSGTLSDGRLSANVLLASSIGVSVQAWDADLDAIAALTTTSTGRALLTESVAQTGTGALVRAAGPTLTGTTSVATLTASGTVTAQTAIRVGTAGANAPYIFPFTANAFTTPDPTGRGLNFYSYVSAAGTISISIAGETATQTSGTNTHLLVQRTFQPTSGTGTYSLATITTTINQTGGANGITRGLFINPTLTAAADFRGIEVGNCGAQKAIVTGTGLVSFGDSVSITGTTRLGTYTVGTLPSAAANTRARAFVSDSNQTFNSANLGATVTAGGAILVPVFSDGTNWVIG